MKKNGTRASEKKCKKDRGVLQKSFRRKKKQTIVVLEMI